MEPHASHSTIPQFSPPVQQTEKRILTHDETKHELQDAIKGSNQVLVSARTKLTMFPDTVSVDRAMITVTKRQFFNSAEVISIRIEDVLNVAATVGPFFGTIRIMSRVMNSDNPYHIGRFTRDDALKIKHVTQGYIIALQRDIDTSSLGTTELAAMLERLGQDNLDA